MRKAASFVIVILAAGIMLATVVSARAQAKIPSEAAQQALLRLLYDPARYAIADYYGAPRQFWRDKILHVQKLPDSAYYEVILQAETFYGPHNPPYGIETMTFHIGYGDVRLERFEHRDEPA